MPSLRDLLDDDARSRLAAEAFPEQPTPMLATLSRDHFDHPNWVYERKFDGQRLLLLVHDGVVSLRSRRNEALDTTYPEIVDAAQDADLPDLVADGEVVAFSGAVTSFARLQQRMGIQDAVKARRSPVAVHVYLFDLLHLGGVSTRGLRLRERKELLREAITFDDPFRFSSHRNADGLAYLEEACSKGWEGLIAKDADSRYVQGRSRAWLKFKCFRRQEFVVGGFTEPRGHRRGFGALLVGHHDGDRLRYAGKVGTGYDQRMLARLTEQLEPLEQGRSPFVDAPRDREVHHVAPQLVVEVTFSEWTRDGRLRHPSFVGLRTDKDPRDVVREDS